MVCVAVLCNRLHFARAANSIIHPSIDGGRIIAIKQPAQMGVIVLIAVAAAVAVTAAHHDRWRLILATKR